MLSILALGIVGLTLVFHNDRYYLDIITLALIWALASTSWNILGGYQNQLAFGHSAFFAIGAYGGSLLFLRRGVSPWLGMWCGFLLAAALSAFVGWLCLRLKGAFYALATFALASVVQIIAVIWVPVTNGDEGLTIPYVPNPAHFIFGSTATYIYVFGAMLIGYIALTQTLEKSRWGLASRALSADEDAAAALGVRVLREKVLGAALSGGLTAIAGTAYAQYELYVHPSSVASIQYSIQVALIAVFGGVGTAFGPLLGAAILIPLSAFLTATLGSGKAATAAPGVTLVTYGVVLILILLYLPEGVGPRVLRLVDDLRRREVRQAHVGSGK
jgi:branched-chain amino acid transport system permease protein